MFVHKTDLTSKYHTVHNFPTDHQSSPDGHVRKSVWEVWRVVCGFEHGYQRFRICLSACLISFPVWWEFLVNIVFKKDDF